MVIDEIKKLRKKLENEIKNNDSYDKIYETSVKLDKLIVEFYNENKDLKKV